MWCTDTFAARGAGALFILQYIYIIINCYNINIIKLYYYLHFFYYNIIFCYERQRAALLYGTTRKIAPRVT